MGVDKLAILGVAFDTRSHAAPHGLVGLRIHAIVVRAHRREIHQTAVAGPLRRQDVVEQSAFDVVGVAYLLVTLEQHVRQAQHVVGVAGFRPFHLIDHGREVGVVMEVLLDAVAADGHRAALAHRVPESLRRPVEARLAGQLADALEPDHLGDLGVGVQAGELVFAPGQGVQDRVVRKAQRKVQVFFVAGQLKDVGEDFVHAAMFAAQHVLHLRVGQAGREL